MSLEGKSVVIATTGNIDRVFHESSIALYSELSKRKVRNAELIVRGCNGWIALARDIACAKFRRSDFTHLFFIDSDEGFRAEDAIRLIDVAGDEDPIGCFYPCKKLDWEAGAQAAIESFRLSSMELTVKELAYTLKHAVSRQTWPHEELGQTDNRGVVEVNWLTFGFTVIPRACLDKYASLTRNQLGYFDAMPDGPGALPIGPGHAFFNNGILDGNRLGEDVTFSKVWKKLGGKLWKLKGVELDHVGAVTF